MSIVGSFGSMPAGVGARFGSTPGRIQGRMVNGVNYPSPFFDVAHTYLPTSMKMMFRWCRYYFLTNPLINATVFKLSEYPVTDIIIEHDNPEVVKIWTEFLQDGLRYRPFQIECGLDYHCYGNALVGMHYPFTKWLSCRTPLCQFKAPAEKCQQHWIFTSLEFRLNCPRCHQVAPADVEDTFIKNASGIKLLRWNPEDVETRINELTGEQLYSYNIPPSVKNDIMLGQRDVVMHIPQLFIKAMKEQKGILFTKDAIFHMKRPNISSTDSAWGTPLLLPVLKDTFYLQIMKKAQEAILLEHIVPLRVLFPQPASGSADPFTSVNLVDWREFVASEIARWRYDNNYIPIMPLPLGNQTIGGDGRALLLTGEITQWSDQIMMGMGVPIEFLRGGMSYAGTNVSMRMLENAFLGYINRQEQLLRWIIKKVAFFMGWPVVGVRFKPFKMADDIQRKMYRLQLNQANKISDTTLLADDDLDANAENRLMINETPARMEAIETQQLATARIQGKVMTVQMKYQAEAQQTQMAAMQAGQAAGEPGGGDVQMNGAGQAMQATQSPLGQEQRMAGDAEGPPTQMDMTTMAMSQAQLLAGMDPQSQEMNLQGLVQTWGPEFADMVRQYLAQITGPAGGANGTPQGGQIDMRALPEQRAPRRAQALV